MGSFVLLGPPASVVVAVASVDAVAGVDVGFRFGLCFASSAAVSASLLGAPHGAVVGVAPAGVGVGGAWSGHAPGGFFGLVPAAGFLGCLASIAGDSAEHAGHGGHPCCGVQDHLGGRMRRDIPGSRSLGITHKPGSIMRRTEQGHSHAHLEGHPQSAPGQHDQRPGRHHQQTLIHRRHGVPQIAEHIQDPGQGAPPSGADTAAAGGAQACVRCIPSRPRTCVPLLVALTVQPTI